MSSLKDTTNRCAIHDCNMIKTKGGYCCPECFYERCLNGESNEGIPPYTFKKGLVCSECWRPLEEDRIIKNETGEVISYSAFCSRCMGDKKVYGIFSPDDYLISLTFQMLPNSKCIPLLFDMQTFPVFKELMRKYRIKLHNGYLALEDNNKKITYFHRFVMKGQIMNLNWRDRMKFDVHHKNRNKFDNRMINLQLMGHELHLKEHEQDKFYVPAGQEDWELSKYHKGFETWCEKVHGEVDDSYMEEFDEWLLSKG